MLTRATNHGCLILAPAKINLSLEVLSRRPDGFHELRTVMSALRLFDTLHVLPAPGGVAGHTVVENDRVRCELSLRATRHQVEPPPADQTNLVFRALDELAKATGRCLDGSVRLVKRIPSQAGLGGGSADAAAALVAGNRAWSLGIDTPTLMLLGSNLGSDVPFFVELLTGSGRAAAVCEGRGERVRSFACRSGLPCVLVKPQQGLSTPEVYRACEQQDHGDRGGAGAAVSGLVRGDWRSPLVNALQPAATRIAPWLEGITNLFHKLPVLAHQMTGSGSAYFALCRDFRSARRVAAAARGLRIGEVYVTATL